MYKNLTKTTYENVQKILEQNKYALSLLSFNRRFDFEQPFTIINHYGSFTANSLEKLIKNIIVDFEAENYTCFVLMKNINNHYSSESFMGVDYYNKKFCQLTQSLWRIKREHLNNYTNYIDNYVRISDFEKDRKDTGCKIYVVIQNNEYVLKTSAAKKSIDCSERMKLIKEEYSYQTIEQGNLVQMERTKYKLDKSGYIKSDYTQRLKALKAEKAKKKADEFNIDTELLSFENEIATLKVNLINSLQTTANTDFEMLDKIYNALRYFKYANQRLTSLVNRYYDNNFNTVNEIERCMDYINADINDANKAIDGGNYNENLRKNQLYN